MEAWGNQSSPQRVGIRSLERTPREQAGQASQPLAVTNAIHSLLAAHHLCACLQLCTTCPACCAHWKQH